MVRPHGRSVALPYSSLLNQLPSRPIACASAIPGARASAQAGRGIPRRRQPIQAPTPPRARAPPAPPRAQAARVDGPPDAEAALADGQRPHRVTALAEVRLRGGDHVVEP